MSVENERKLHPRMVFKENKEGIDDDKVLLHDKIWDL